MKKVIAFYTNWSGYDRNIHVKDIPITSITHVHYAFSKLMQGADQTFQVVFTDPWADTDQRYTQPGQGVDPPDTWDAHETGPFGHLGQFKKLKLHYPHFKLSGWNMSNVFSRAFETDASRLQVVSCILQLLQDMPWVDGVDIDWEFISPPHQQYGKPGNATHPNDARHFIYFLQLLKSTLAQHGLQDKQVSACVSGDPIKLACLYLDEMCTLLDSILVMTYDYQSSQFGPCLSGHHSPLYSTPYSPLSIDSLVHYLIQRNIPLEKVIVGAVTYSRGFAHTRGLGEPSQGIVSDKSWEEGVCDYKTLPRPGAIEYWDDIAKAHYSFDAHLGILNSYDTVASVKAKCDYILRENLGGIMVWEISGDRMDAGSLIRTCFNTLNPQYQYNVLI